MIESNPPQQRPTPTSPTTLRSRAVRGALWWTGAYPLLKAIQIASNVILARLLSPTAFGVVAIASVLVQAVTMFSEFGISYALIQSTRDDERFVNTAWTMQIGRGVLVCLACAVIATPVASLYGTQELAPIIRAIGLGAVITGLQSTKYMTLNRALNERPRALLHVAESMVTRGSMIVMALMLPNAWSLIVGTLTGAVFVTTATHFLPGRSNRLAWDPESARVLMSFGSWVVVGAVIAYLGGQLDTLLLGKLVTAHLDALGLVGVYGIARRVANLPFEAAEMLGEKLAFPLLAEVARSEPHRFRERLLQLRSAFLPSGIALCLGIVVIAPWFFGLLYDGRYAAARWMAPLMTLSVWVGFMNNLPNKALLSLGRTRTLAITGGIRAVTSITGGIAGFLLGEIPGFILGLAIGDLLRHVAELAFLAHEGVAVHRQDVRFTLLFLGLSAPCAVGPAWAAAGGLGSMRWVVGLLLPMAVFFAVAAWAARGAWRLARPR